MKNNRNKSVIIVSHKYVTQPDDELREYLQSEKYENVLHIRHSFLEIPHRKSYFTWYKNGRLFKGQESLDYSFLPEPLLYLKELVYTVYWILSSKQKWDVYIGMDGLCTLFGLLVKVLQQKQLKVIFWVIDFVPHNRFEQEWKHAIYEKINTLSYKNATEVWDLSPRMFKARQKFLNLKKEDYKKIRVVPYGSWLSKITTVPYSKCQKNTIVFMGHIKENQGVQLVLQAIAELKKKGVKAQLKVIGSGPYVSELIKIADSLGITNQCSFLGRIEDHAVVEKEIAKSALAVSTYITKLDTWTYYADPGKVKTYLACGVPVLLTDLPWNAREIEQAKAGKITSENPTDVAHHILKLLEPKTNQTYRKNARKYAQSFDYETIFKSLHI